MKQKLEARLKLAKATEDTYLADRTLLRTYLMLSDIEHLDMPETEADEKKCAELLAGEPQLSANQLATCDGTEVGAVTAIWAEILCRSRTSPRST